MTTTTYLGLTLPTVGADDNTWGGELNGNFNIIDPLFANIGNNAFGTAALKAIGTSGATVPLLNGTNTWAGPQTFSGGLTGTLTGNAAGLTAYNSAHQIFLGFSGSKLTVKVDGTDNGSTFPIDISGNAATATTSAACSGNAATATSASACSGNAATASSAAALNCGLWTVNQRGSDGWLEFIYNGTTMMSLSNIDGTLKVLGTVIINTTP